MKSTTAAQLFRQSNKNGQTISHKAKKKITGVMLWDLSAAFDTLNAGIFCDKLKIFSSAKKEIKLFCQSLPI